MRLLAICSFLALLFLSGCQATPPEERFVPYGGRNR